jgi:hypothetical protein
VEAQLAHDTEEKKRRRRDEMIRRELGKCDKNKIRGINNRAAYCAERVRLMQHGLIVSARDRSRRCRTGEFQLLAHVKCDRNRTAAAAGIELQCKKSAP